MIARAAWRDAGLLYALMLALITALAGALLIFGSAPAARRLIPLDFGRLQPNLHTAASIALDNGRVALVPLGLAALAGGARTLRVIADLVLCLVLAFNAAELSAALAGYGARAVAALTPHAQLELAGYAVAGTAYLRGRRREATAVELIAFGVTCALLLAAAALLETYVQLRVRG
jgi:hypothetical protein